MYKYRLFHLTFRVSYGFFAVPIAVPKERRNFMNKERKVVEYRRKPDGIYEPVEMEPSIPRPCEGNESKRICELANYGNTIFRIDDGKNGRNSGLCLQGHTALAVSRSHFRRHISWSRKEKPSYSIPIDMHAKSNCGNEKSTIANNSLITGLL